MSGREWIELPIGLAAVAGALAYLWRQVVRPVLNGLKKLGRNADGLIHAADKIGEIDHRLVRVESVVTPNGGTSIIDVVRRIEENQATVKAELLEVQRAAGVRSGPQRTGAE